jgi:hypothetical protein
VRTCIIISDVSRRVHGEIKLDDRYTVQSRSASGCIQRREYLYVVTTKLNGPTTGRYVRCIVMF